MSPPPVENCRVLELGCGSGGNLLPLAAALPEGRFVGIDLSRRQIADGQHAARAAGLDNVELRAESILEAGDLGTFDYILCHGVYSWVPAAVQDRILEICARHLAPNGIAYVSYNTYPGWHLPGRVREMMRYHADRFAEPQVRVRQARALLEFLAGSALPETDAYGGALQKELTMLRGLPDYYLFHEYLAEVNAPVYFHEFNERAGARGLQYLGEAAFLDMLAEHFAPAVPDTLRLLATDLVQAEQYMDFLRNRRFRQTLLCHRDVRLNRSLDLDALDNAYVASPFQPVSASPDVGSAAVEEFRTAQGFPLTTGEPMVKAALVHLAEAWPQPVPLVDLEHAVRVRLGSAADASLERLRVNLLKGVGPRALELRITPPRFVQEIGPRPTTTPLARFQAAAGTAVTNLRHQAVGLSLLDRLVLCHLDGRHDRAELVRVLADEADRENPDQVLDESLGRLACHALLAR
jgi:methyltransferase-like protein